MKTCPKCGRGYSDDLSFCLEDGSRLPGGPTIGLAIPPTEQYRLDTNQNPDISTAETLVSRPNVVSPTPKQFRMSAVDPASRMGCIVTAGQVSAVLLLIFGIGIAGIFYTFSGGSELASKGPEVYNTSTNPPTSTANANVSSANLSSNTISVRPLPMATDKPLPIATDKPPPIDSGNVQARPRPTTRKPPETVSGGIVNGKALSLPQPPYPPAARAVRASGAVNVHVLIDETGRVVSATAVSGHPLLRSAAAQAARGARFNPTLLSGQPVKVSGVITYNFVP